MVAEKASLRPTAHASPGKLGRERDWWFRDTDPGGRAVYFDSRDIGRVLYRHPAMVEWERCDEERARHGDADKLPLPQFVHRRLNAVETKEVQQLLDQYASGGTGVATDFARALRARSATLPLEETTVAGATIRVVERLPAGETSKSLGLDVLASSEHATPHWSAVRGSPRKDLEAVVEQQHRRLRKLHERITAIEKELSESSSQTEMDRLGQALRDLRAHEASLQQVLPRSDFAAPDTSFGSHVGIATSVHRQSTLTQSSTKAQASMRARWRNHMQRCRGLTTRISRLSWLRGLRDAVSLGTSEYHVVKDDDASVRHGTLWAWPGREGVGFLERHAVVRTRELRPAVDGDTHPSDRNFGVAMRRLEAAVRRRMEVLAELCTRNEGWLPIVHHEIADVLDSQEQFKESTRLFLLVPFIASRAPTLHSWMRLPERPRPSPERLFAWTRALVKALRGLHAAGIAHGRLSPRAVCMGWSPGPISAEEEAEGPPTVLLGRHPWWVGDNVLQEIGEMYDTPTYTIGDDGWAGHGYNRGWDGEEDVQEGDEETAADGHASPRRPMDRRPFGDDDVLFVRDMDAPPTFGGDMWSLGRVLTTIVCRGVVPDPSCGPDDCAARVPVPFMSLLCPLLRRLLHPVDAERPSADSVDAFLASCDTRSMAGVGDVRLLGARTDVPPMDESIASQLLVTKREDGDLHKRDAKRLTFQAAAASLRRHFAPVGLPLALVRSDRSESGAYSLFHTSASRGKVHLPGPSTESPEPSGIDGDPGAGSEEWTGSLQAGDGFEFGRTRNQENAASGGVRDEDDEERVDGEDGGGTGEDIDVSDGGKEGDGEDGAGIGEGISAAVTSAAKEINGGEGDDIGERTAVTSAAKEVDGEDGVGMGEDTAVATAAKEINGEEGDDIGGDTASVTAAAAKEGDGEDIGEGIAVTAAVSEVNGDDGDGIGEEDADAPKGGDSDLEGDAPIARPTAGTGVTKPPSPAIASQTARGVGFISSPAAAVAGARWDLARDPWGVLEGRARWRRGKLLQQTETSPFIGTVGGGRMRRELATSMEEQTAQQARLSQEAEGDSHPPVRPPVRCRRATREEIAWSRIGDEMAHALPRLRAGYILDTASQEFETVQSQWDRVKRLEGILSGSSSRLRQEDIRPND